VADFARRALVRGYALISGSSFWRSSLGESLFVQAFFAYKSMIEDPFLALSRKRPDLFSGGDILDVGANIGYTATVFARVASPGSRVIAIEPEPDNVARLRRTLRRKGVLDRVEIVEAAAGEVEQLATLERNPLHPGDHALARPGISAVHPLTVKVVRLDDLVMRLGSRPVAFIKIDVQGWELSVSRGMERLLATPGITVAVEYSPESALAAGQPGPELLAFYRERGFETHAVLHDGSLVDLESPEASAILSQRGYIDLICRRPASSSRP
jgi:FkbM family methyltransferase